MPTLKKTDVIVIGLLLGPKFISWLRVRQGKGQPIRSDGPQSHLAKRGTPTMGGLLILIAVTVSVLMGHRDTTMISRVYSHVGERHDHMRKAANRARGA